MTDTELIQIYVRDDTGEQVRLEVPTDMNLSLMEVLKASEYPIQATCGGMALCATCLIQVLEGDGYQEASDPEWDMLDTLPFVEEGSRLACQMKIEPEMNQMVIRLGAHT